MCIDTCTDMSIDVLRDMCADMCTEMQPGVRDDQHISYGNILVMATY